MTVTIDRQHGANAWLTVGLREGKNREIRRAMEAVHLSVNRLIRTSYGPFQLGELKSGEVEEIKRKVVRDQLGIELADNSGTAVKKKPSQLKRTPRKPGAPGPGRPGLPKAPTEKLATANSASGKPKPGYGKSKPARTAFDAPAPRKFGTRVKSTRKP